MICIYRLAILSELLHSLIQAFRKEKRVAGIIKKFDSPLTLYQGVLQSDFNKRFVKNQITQNFNSLDPFSIENRVKNKIKNSLNFTYRS
jgi:hypothetical protein